MTSRSVRFGRNVLWNMAGQTCLLALSFFLIPYLVRGLGKEGYALYGLMGLVAGYLALLQFGASNTTIKFIAEYLGKGDDRGLRTTLQLSLALHGGVVLVGAALVFLWRHGLVLDILKVSPGMRETGSFVIGCTAVAAIFFSLMQCGNAILQGVQRFSLVNAANVLQSAGVLGGAAVLLYLGYGLPAVALLYIAVHVALAAAALAIGISLLPGGMRAYLGGRPDPESARRFFDYAVPIFFVQLTWAVTFQWDKFLIGYFFPLAHLTHYLIPAFLMQKFWILPSSVMASAFPLISELSGRGERDSVRKLYRQVGQLILWLVVPGFSILFVVAPHFLTLWLGADFSDEGVWPLRFLLAGYLFHLLAAMPVTAAFGIGKPRHVLVWYSLQAVLCTCSWFLLIPRFGITGAALGFMLTQALTSLPFAWFVSWDFFRMGLPEYVGAVIWRPLAAGAVFAIFLWPLREYAWHWWSLISLVAVSTLLYYAVGYCLLGREERETLAYLWEAVRDRGKGDAP